MCAMFDYECDLKKYPFNGKGRIRQLVEDMTKELLAARAGSDEDDDEDEHYPDMSGVSDCCACEPPISRLTAFWRGTAQARS